mmetsp:Transcript_9104/g.19874  ORF Transcript_9104/g.19874 Transcript_9104/m.19874 type:complete len:115 (+) Transcript_9104:89-433(+)|eukprot:CAMPEP_0204268716 /NCGR_PEP_ID=MMETSP0468-20130131/14147_1 /ASSEMBLY_ACC=CAM_ASM_000383 /TAXON_ID=2969 /ORGANISM="Oxyrrhis marina" /LENGTH=114 /DNA_ID=CAMNT_0051244017 /DNA_START=94 /DNA_END=438 /DNA_ORIENTATION=+
MRSFLVLFFLVVSRVVDEFSVMDDDHASLLQHHLEFTAAARTGSPMDAGMAFVHPDEVALLDAPDLMDDMDDRVIPMKRRSSRSRRYPRAPSVLDIATRIQNLAAADPQEEPAS